MSKRAKPLQKLNKAQLTQGRNYTEDVVVEALDGVVTIRPLTQPEIDEIAALGNRGIDVRLDSVDPEEAAAMLENGKANAADMPDMHVRIDLAEIELGKAEQRYRTVAYGLSIRGGEVWSVADVKMIDIPGAVAQLAAEVWRISKVSEGDLDALKDFRQQ